MSGSAFASDDAGLPRPSSRSEEGSAGRPGQDQELLDRVLRNSLAMVQSDEAIDAEEMNALLAVARRHRGEALNVEPIAQELVAAMLRGRFEQLANSAEFRQRMSLWIASTLMDDPEAQQRLESLWMRLLDKTA